MHSSWIFSIDNEWIFVVIMKPGPDFGTRILGPQLFSETTTEGSRILDSGFRDLSRASSTCFAILDSGFYPTTTLNPPRPDEGLRQKWRLAAGVPFSDL